MIEREKEVSKRVIGIGSKMYSAIFLVSAFCLLLSLFFISSNFTGFAVSALGEDNMNFAGVMLFIAGIILMIIYIRKHELS
jgi:magnesium-transporting ATPase (P-type)